LTRKRKKDQDLKALKKRNHELDKELQRMEKALAEGDSTTSSVKKKLDALMTDQKDG
jgi:prefoldin subunit 5